MIANLPTLAIATGNQGKLSEFREMLGEGVTLVSLADLGLDSPEETGSTFEENAELKARHVFQLTGLPVLADDSGLVVDALDGAPGVLSARYAGPGASDAGNRARLLQDLDGVPASNRGSRFVCVIALVDQLGGLHLSRGTCEGSIAFEERGEHGFGYDPLFELPDGRMMGELEPWEKNRISHRSKALQHAGPEVRRILGIGVP
jgi:XTP/dITP diphosphohydrolase